MGYNVKFIAEGKIKKNKKKKILKIAKKNNIKIKAPCKKGKCGKCLVQIVEGSLPEPTKNEIKNISSKKLDKGYRLACESKIDDDAVIRIV
jgi:ferredoxin